MAYFIFGRKKFRKNAPTSRIFRSDLESLNSILDFNISLSPLYPNKEFSLYRNLKSHNVTQSHLKIIYPNTRLINDVSIYFQFRLFQFVCFQLSSVEINYRTFNPWDATFKLSKATVKWWNLNPWDATMDIDLLWWWIITLEEVYSLFKLIIRCNSTVGYGLFS